MAASPIDTIRALYAQRRFSETADYVRDVIAQRLVTGADWRLVANAAISLADNYSAALAADLWRAEQPDVFEAIHFAAQTKVRAVDFPGALERVNELLEKFSGSPHAWFGASVIIAQGGDLDRAIAGFRRAYEMDDRFIGSWEQIARLKRFESGDSDLDVIFSLPEKAAPLGSRFTISANYACAMALDQLGETDRAFAHFTEGARQVRAAAQQAPDPRPQLLKNALDAFTSDLIEKHSGTGFESAAPIFVVGPPRSGTTLVEQILASHPDIVGGGELAMMRLASWPLPEYSTANVETLLEQEGVHCWRSMGALYNSFLAETFGEGQRVANKDISAIMCIGLIRLILPNAKVVFVNRDPMDTAWSCFKAHLGPTVRWSFDFEEIAAYCGAFFDARAIWRERMPDFALDVEYEKVVEDPKAEIDRLLAFCDLSPCAACYSFHETERQVLTASLYQVRQPLYSSSVGEWRKYEKHLAPLHAALERRGLIPA